MSGQGRKLFSDIVRTILSPSPSQVIIRATRGARITKAASLRRKELEVFEDFEDDLSPKEYGSRILKAG
jgi:hypothetical protein